MRTERGVTIFLCVLAIVLGSGCASARLVARGTRGGRMQVAGAYMERTREARSAMRAYCGGAYRVEGAAGSEASASWSTAPDRAQSEFEFVCVAPSSGHAIAGLR